MRLIDADELLKNWGQTFFAMGGDRLGANGEEIMFYLNGLIREIKNAPTVSTYNLEKHSFIEGYKAGCEKGKKCYERPQGKWIDYSNEGYVECPFCGEATNCEDNKDELHYCFHCGADMRGDKE